jgi:Ca2+-transporting ATPase
MKRGSEMPHWHSLPAQEVLTELGSSPHGLSPDEIVRRRNEYGTNELVEKKPPSLLKRLLDQLKSLLVIILLGAVVVALALGEWVDASVVGAIVIINAILGLVQDARAERALAALKRMSSPLAQVLRENRVMEIPTQELVPGDLVLLASGSKIPADARLLKGVNLQVDEAPLTGESLPVEKEEPALPEQTPLADRHNMLYMGTTVTYGRGEAVVVSTGMATEIGKIATLLQKSTKEITPLQRNLEQVGRILAILVGAVCLLVLGVGALHGIPLLTMFLIAVSLAVAAIPEGLPAIVTIVLALGTQRMAKRGAIVRHLPAVETLGSTSVICSDKTGTLTLNEMMVEKIVTPSDRYEVTGSGYEPGGEVYLDEQPIVQLPSSLELLLRAATLNTDATLQQTDGQWQIVGDPTEGALVVLAAKNGFWKEQLEQEYQRIDEVPFSSERKMMTTVFHSDAATWVFSKGAPDLLLNSCTHYRQEQDEHPLTLEWRERFERQNAELAREGLRVLGIAYRQTQREETHWEQGMVFLGLAAMRDPARAEAKQAIATCRQAGIKPVMITGDHLLTATAIGSQLNLIGHEREAITGTELSTWSDPELLQAAPHISVYARVSPEDKVRILTAYQRLGNVVAMTGDGVNDAPALKKADIGVAMGITGTDVTKEAADMILTDDNFATIVSAVEEGRTIFTNIRKFLSFLLSCNLGEVLSVFLGFFLFPAAGVLLTAPQILWMNLVTDGLPALALGMDPAAADVMQHPPRPRREGVFTRPLYLWIAISALIMTAGTLLAFWFGNGEGGRGQSMAFTTLVLLELLFALNSRSQPGGARRVAFFQNRYLLWACLGSLLLQLALLYVPFLNDLFETVPLSGLDWGIIAAICAGCMIVLEGIKRLWRPRPARR